jgi:hypothetical protein
MHIEIMFEDLKEKKQKEILKILGIKNAKEMNWDIFPFDILEVDEDV